MIFLSPIWLALFLPWLALAIWLLLGRHRATVVPFIDLWRGSTDRPRAARQIVLPPASLIAIIIALLFVILAAAGPTIDRSHTKPNVTVILDRGITMAPTARRTEVIESTRKALDERVNVTLAAVPPVEVTTWSGLTAASPTCVDTAADLSRAVADALSRNADPVVVLTDQPLASNPRVVVIGPTKPIANVAITRFAVREHPTTQAMVTVRNDSPLIRCNLRIEDKTQPIDLPQPGQERSYFVDLPTIGATAQGSIDAPDDFDGDNAAYLTRQRTSPKIELRGNLSPEVQRVIRAYEDARPPSDKSESITVAASPDQVSPAQPAIISPLAVSPISRATVVAAHPITSNLNPQSWTDLQVAALPSNSDWMLIITSEKNQPLIAIRQNPRQVWIGISSPTLSRSPDFVILWANAIDWVSERSPQTYVAQTVGTLGPRAKPRSGHQLWPGFYGDDSGSLIAANAPPAHFRQSAADPNLQPKLAALSVSRAGVLNLAPILAIAAIASICVAAILWPGAQKGKS